MGTIADKLTLLNTSKINFKEMLQYANSNITDETTFRNYVKGVFDAYINILNNPDDLFNTLPKKAVAAGTSQNIPGTIEAPMRITLKTSALEQTTYTGKNLFNGSSVYQDQTLNGVTLKNNGDGSFTITGTATADFEFTTNIISAADLTTKATKLPAGTYRQQFASRLQLYDENYNWVVNTWSEFTTTQELYVRNAFFTISNGQTYNTTLWYQIEAGSTKTSYEPYVGGTASPNPSYPQDIHTISGDNSVVVEGKNLCNTFIATKPSWQAGTLVVNSDGSFTVSGNTGSNNYFSLNQKVRVLCPSLKAGDVVYLYLETTNTNKKIYASGMGGGGWYSGNSLTLTDTILNNNLVIYGGYNQTDTIKITITKVQVATEYVPYQEPQTAPINLPVENLFDKDTCTDSAWLIEDGSITSPHTGYSVSDYILVSPNTDYYRTKTGSTRGKYYDKNKQPLNTTSYQDIPILGNAGTFTTPSNCYYIRMTINTLTTDLNTIQLEPGTKANSYTPYGTTPIEYCKIGNYEDEFILTSGKNKLDLTDLSYLKSINTAGTWSGNTYTIYGITYTFNEGGTIKANGTSTGNAGLSLYGTSINQKTINGKYILLGATTNNIAMRILNHTGSYNFLGTNNSATTPTELDLSTYKTGYIELMIYSGKTINNVLLTPMLTETPITNFEPYGTNQWYLKKNIGKVVLDGSESWLMSITSRFYITLDRLTGNTLGYCNYFENKPSLSTNNGITFYQTNQNIYIYYDGCTTTTDFKTWLSTHNTTVYYVLATPTYTQITGTLETQLNNIYKKLLSYDGITNISQANNDLPFIINTSVLEDLG